MQEDEGDACEFMGKGASENCALARDLDNLDDDVTLDSHHWLLPLPLDFFPPFPLGADGRPPAVQMLDPWSRLKQRSHW